MGHVALGQTNHGNINGSLKHIKACEAQGIIPICGIETYWRPDRLVRDAEWRYKRWHLVLMAKNLRGWHNLIRISSEAYASGMYQNPCIDFDLQERFSEGLMCSTSCVLGPLPHLIQNGAQREVDEWVDRALKIHGDDLYFSIMPHDFDQQRAINLEIISIANRHGCPIVYEGDSHYPEKGWVDTQKVAILIGMNKTFAEAEAENRARIASGEEIYELWHDGLHLMDEGEVRAAFAANHPDISPQIVDEAIRNTDFIASQIEPFLMDRSIKMPRASQAPRDTVLGWCREELARLGLDRNPVYMDRLEYEASVLDKRRNWDYFCVPLDSQILTKDGWKTWDQVIVGIDETIGYDFKAGLARWTKITDVHRKKDDVVQMGESYLQLRCTPDHRWVVTDRNGWDLYLHATRDLNSEHHLFLCAEAEGGTSEWSADQARLLALILCDGSWDETKKGTICSARVYQAKPQGIEYIEQLLARMDIRYRKVCKSAGVNYPIFSFYLPNRSIKCILDLLGSVRAENFDFVSTIIQMSSDARSAFLEAAFVAEGHETAKGYRSLGQNDGPVQDAIVLAAYLGGIRTRVGGNSRCKTISLMKRPNRARGHRQQFIGRQEVWCPTTELGTWTMRQGSHVALTGNCLVGEFTRWARSTDPLPPTPEDPFPKVKKPIRINSGRGSCAASLICYLSRITRLDPIAHKFKFERFLNPDRKGLPDIDLDIATTRRPEAKEYFLRKFGRAHVADVMSQQHFQPRAALQLVTRTIYGYDSEAFQEIARLTHENTGVIDPVHDSNLPTIREREPELDSWAQRHPDAWMHAERLENYGDPSVLRLSKHAAAIVILPGEVTDHMAVIRADENDSTFRTAWAETPRLSIVDDFGIVKIDLLGLKGMDQQQMVLDSHERHTGAIIDLDELPALKNPYEVEDEVMEIFRQGLTLGVNQFSGDGMRTLLKRAKPNNIIDLAALNALYRPGPMGEKGHWAYCDRKNGIEPYTLHEQVKPVLGDTYATIAFQEQVMELFEVLAGFTAAEADGVRKIIAKLYREKGGVARQKLDELKERFVPAASAIVGTELAEKLWSEILPYSGYSFNRPHAGSYSIQAYQDAWEKRHLTLDFYAALLTLESKKSAAILREAKKFGVPVLPPDVNVSEDGFTPDFEAQALRYGLEGIKGIGEAASEQIMRLRPFTSFEDFMERNSQKYSKCNKKVREILVRVGALDRFGAREGWTNTQKAEAEIELIGVGLAPGGTLGQYEELVMQHIHSEEEFDQMPEGEVVIFGGRIIELRKTVTKRGKNPGQTMCFIKVGLGFDVLRGVCFPPIWSTYSSDHNGHAPLLYEGAAVMVRGKKSGEDMIVDSLMGVPEFVSEISQTVQGVAA